MTDTSKTVISSKIKLIFFGTGPVAAESLDFLVNHFEIEAVITKSRAPGHKGNAPVEDICKQHGLSPLFVTGRHDLDELIMANHFKSQLGIVVDFGVIMSQQVISSFTYGIINSHFSLLPEWRGADPISYSILSGQQKTGVSLMLIEPELDTGKLITQQSIAIDSKETTGSLTKKLVQFSNMLLLKYIPLYFAGDIKPHSQPHPDRATYSHKLSKADSVINWGEDAATIERKIRAYQPWPKARTRLGSIDCIITAAEVISTQGAHPASTLQFGSPKQDTPYLTIICGQDALAITTIQPMGKKEMPIQAFLAGYKSQIVGA